MHATEEHPPRVELFDYPVPDGIVVPNLMPYQLRAWNGDGYLAAEVLRLKKAHGLTSALETGTCLGSTTAWLVENFPFHVRSYEINPQYHAIAMERVPGAKVERPHPMVDLVLEDSRGLVMQDVDGMADRTFVFLDAHWNEHCPLLDELTEISKVGAKPCILIHDFQVPGTDFGFDKMPDGRPFNLELIGGHLNAIYGEGGWKHNYPTSVEGACRGWVSIEPVSVP